MKTNEKNAAAAYAEQAAAIQLLLNVLSDKLVSHAVAANKAPKNFGHVGDLSHVREELEGVYGFLGGNVDKFRAQAASYAAASKGGAA